MSILVNEHTRVICQGFTGKQGTFHTKQSIAYGTQVVGGVTPGKGGLWHLDLPIFSRVDDAVRSVSANASMIFVPARFAYDSIVEAIEANIAVIACITENIPVQDMIKIQMMLKSRPHISFIGPNCPGVITPPYCRLGIMPGHIHRPGRVGIVSRSGTLAYEAVFQISALGEGQSTSVGIGGDPIGGLSFIDCFKLFESDEQTDVIVMIGEIGGSAEEEAANYIKKHVKKPVVAYIAGKTAPKGKRMGHAGAIISQGLGTYHAKIEALESAGVYLARNVVDIGATLKTALQAVNLDK